MVGKQDSAPCLCPAELEKRKLFSLTNLIGRREESLLFHGAWLHRQQNTKAFETTQALPTVSLPTRSLAIFPQSGSEARSLQMQ